MRGVYLVVEDEEAGLMCECLPLPPHLRSAVYRYARKYRAAFGCWPLGAHTLPGREETVMLPVQEPRAPRK